jgi:hypothetical protein
VGGGAEALVPAWNCFKDSDKELQDLLTTAFCDVMVNGKLRSIVIETAKDAKIDDLIFMTKLTQIDSDLAFRTFGRNVIRPDTIPIVDSHPADVWHADIWKKHVSGLASVWK